MEETKPKELQDPTTIEQQVENLLEKKLTINDVEQAKSFLSRVSYYRFIKAYSLGLKPKNGNYNEGVTFEQLCDIYNFNKRLRQSLFPLIENIEIRLRCSISNYFSTEYGSLGYENSTNFVNAKYHSDFLLELNNEISRNYKTPYIINYQNNYENGKIPFYAAIELFSFGMLSKFYSNLKNEDKKIIAKTGFDVGYTFLESWIESISFVRNICAHYGRLYNVKLSKQPVLLRQFSAISNYRIFAVILCIKTLVDDKMIWQTFTDELISLVELYENSINLDYIGFTGDWDKLLKQ